MKIIKYRKDEYVVHFESTDRAMVLNKEEYKELKKENAGLRARLNAINLLTLELQKASNLKTQQLTKAKEIINDCVRELQNILFYKKRNKERIASTLDKAEQFLNSEVEK